MQGGVPAFSVYILSKINHHKDSSLDSGTAASQNNGLVYAGYPCLAVVIGGSKLCTAFPIRTGAYTKGNCLSSFHITVLCHGLLQHHSLCHACAGNIGNHSGFQTGTLQGGNGFFLGKISKIRNYGPVIRNSGTDYKLQLSRLRCIRLVGTDQISFFHRIRHLLYDLIGNFSILQFLLNRTELHLLKLR